MYTKQDWNFDRLRHHVNEMGDKAYKISVTCTSSVEYTAAKTLKRSKKTQCFYNFACLLFHNAFYGEDK
ncbi:unnamed protein product [Caenorhabditis brenneri]